MIVRLRGGASASTQAQAPRHAEMQDQRAAIEGDQEVFGAAPDAPHG